MKRLGHNTALDSTVAGLDMCENVTHFWTHLIKCDSFGPTTSQVTQTLLRLSATHVVWFASVGVMWYADVGVCECDDLEKDVLTNVFFISMTESM